MNDPSPNRWQRAALLVALVGLAGVACFFMWGMIRVCVRHYIAVRGNRPLPNATQFFMDYRLAVALLPSPWALVAGWLVWRERTSAFSLILFSSTLLMTVVTVAVLVITALTMPWIEHIVVMQ